MTRNNELAVTYEVDGQELTVTADDVRNYISTSPNVTDKEVRAFLELCASQRLDPRRKDAHLIKYGGNPATMVVGKDVFTRRAQKNPRFRGFEAGITFINPVGNLQRRDGSMLLPGESLVGGWCKVFVEGYENPMKEEVSFEEYAGKRKDGSLNQQWSSKPATMIRKVAIVHALREAFPEDLAGLYDEAEMGNVEPPASKSKLDYEAIEAIHETLEETGWVPDELYAPVESQPAPSWEEMMGLQDEQPAEVEYVIEDGMEAF